jgi:sterol desaturase/sphingolipid hydroxylase (fatty acid hydroxylase superfamily)
MNTTFFICWGLVLAMDGILMSWLTWAANSKKYGRYRIRTPQAYEIPRSKKIINTQLNNMLSLSMFGAFAYFLGATEIYAGWPGLPRLLGEVLGVLLLYDFMYYFFHRAMHHPKVMRHMHGVHHFVRFPTSDESIYLHPGETLGGVGLLILSVVVVGPISNVSFIVMFAIYSSVNIIVHSNLVFPHPAFRLFNFWTTSHDVHHHKVKHNYASIFPFWDQMFGTYRTGPL